MPRQRAPENMSYTELAEFRGRIDRLMTEKRNEARTELKSKLAELAKKQRMSLDEVIGTKIGKGKGRGKAKVAIKYRDPINPSNTWTGRGRTPRWMVAAMKGRKAKKEDFLVQ